MVHGIRESINGSFSGSRSGYYVKVQPSSYTFFNVFSLQISPSSTLDSSEPVCGHDRWSVYLQPQGGGPHLPGVQGHHHVSTITTVAKCGWSI